MNQPAWPPVWKPLTPDEVELPGHAAVAVNHSTAGSYALVLAVLGTGLAYLFYVKPHHQPG